MRQINLIALKAKIILSEPHFYPTNVHVVKRQFFTVNITNKKSPFIHLTHFKQQRKVVERPTQPYSN